MIVKRNIMQSIIETPKIVVLETTDSLQKATPSARKSFFEYFFNYFLKNYFHFVKNMVYYKSKSLSNLFLIKIHTLITGFPFCRFIM